ncbi:MAG: enoyl-CoA hydratase/isomerase family protein [Promethearchaeota archaeon]
MSQDDIVLYEIKRKVARITLNRPPVHAFNLDLFKRFHERLVEAENDDKAKCLLIKSTDKKFFSAGFDMKIKPGDETSVNIKDVLKYTKLNTQKMLLMKKPIIVQVQGTAIGYGMMVIMASDLRIFADRPFPEMYFRMPEIAISMFPRALATFMCLRNFGLTFAKNILLTSDKFGLEHLKNLNFPTRVFPPDELDSKTEEFLKDFVKYKDSIMFLIKSSLTLMHNKYIETWAKMEEDCSNAVLKKRSFKEWDDFIENLLMKYP